MTPGVAQLGGAPAGGRAGTQDRRSWAAGGGGGSHGAVGPLGPVLPNRCAQFLSSGSSGRICAMGDPERPEAARPEEEEVKILQLLHPPPRGHAWTLGCREPARPLQDRCRVVFYLSPSQTLCRPERSALAAGWCWGVGPPARGKGGGDLCCSGRGQPWGPGPGRLRAGLSSPWSFLVRNLGMKAGCSGSAQEMLVVGLQLKS